MLTLELPGYPGEGIRKFDEGDFGIQEVTPMPEEGRAFERDHGYLPCLHLAEKWGSAPRGLLHDKDIILAAQRGELPRFPVGAPVTAEMYAPPPRKENQNLFHCSGRPRCECEGAPSRPRGSYRSFDACGIARHHSRLHGTYDAHGLATRAKLEPLHL